MAVALNGATLTGTLPDTGGDSVTLTSWTPDSDDLILVVVAMRGTGIVPTVAGNGLTWTTTGDVTNAQTQMRLFMFQAQGNAPTTGSIVVTVTGNLLPVTVQAQRFSGVDTDTPVEATATNAGPPVTDDRNMLQAVATVTANALVVAGGTYRLGVFTVPGGEVGIDINLVAGTGGATTTTSIWDQGPVAQAPESTQLGDLLDLDTARDWCIIVASVKAKRVERAATYDGFTVG